MPKKQVIISVLNGDGDADVERYSRELDNKAALKGNTSHRQVAWFRSEIPDGFFRRLLALRHGDGPQDKVASVLDPHLTGEAFARRETLWTEARPLCFRQKPLRIVHW